MIRENKFTPYFWYNEGSSLNGLKTITLSNDDSNFHLKMNGFNFEAENSGVIPNIEIYIELVDDSRNLLTPDKYINSFNLKPYNINLIGKSKYFPSLKLGFKILPRGCCKFHLKSSLEFDYRFMCNITRERIEGGF